MEPHIKIRVIAGTLKGMDRQIECLVGIPVADHPHQSPPSVHNVPPDLIDGEYEFSDGITTIRFKRKGGRWI